MHAGLPHAMQQEYGNFHFPTIASGHPPLNNGLQSGNREQPANRAHMTVGQSKNQIRYHIIARLQQEPQIALDAGPHRGAWRNAVYAARSILQHTAKIHCQSLRGFLCFQNGRRLADPETGGCKDGDRDITRREFSGLDERQLPLHTCHSQKQAPGSRDERFPPALPGKPWDQFDPTARRHPLQDVLNLRSARVWAGHQNVIKIPCCKLFFRSALSFLDGVRPLCIFLGRAFCRVLLGCESHEIRSQCLHTPQPAWRVPEGLRLHATPYREPRAISKHKSFFHLYDKQTEETDRMIPPRLLFYHGV